MRGTTTVGDDRRIGATRRGGAHDAEDVSDVLRNGKAIGETNAFSRVFIIAWKQREAANGRSEQLQPVGICGGQLNYFVTAVGIQQVCSVIR